MRAERDRSRGRARRLRLLFFLAGLAGCASGGTGPSSSDRPRAESAETAAEPGQAVFTAEQAERGQRVFGNVCSVCHGRTEFTGPIFALTWMAEPVGSLFQHIATTMPYDDPGSLTADEYAAVVAYLLRLNGRAAGDRPLPVSTELLGRMRW